MIRSEHCASRTMYHAAAFAESNSPAVSIYVKKRVIKKESVKLPVSSLAARQERTANIDAGHYVILEHPVLINPV